MAEEWSRRCAKGGEVSRTCPIDHQAMNGQVERAQGILGGVMRALLKARDSPTKYWPLAMETAGYILNRSPHSALGNKTPLEIGTKVKPDASRMKVFGCLAHVQIPKMQRKGKLSDTAWSGVMAGYSTNSPEWLILDLRTRKIRKGYSVTFNEAASGFERTQRKKWHVPAMPDKDKTNNEPKEYTPDAGQRDVEMRNTDRESPDNSSTNSPSAHESDDSSWEGIETTK